jgi:predicted enzyme related to lactoylglutathione lyase
MFPNQTLLKQKRSICRTLLSTAASLSVLAGTAAAQNVAVGAQYDSTHVYMAPTDTDAFVKCFLGTFGGTSTKQVVTTVTPTPSKTTSQLLQTPVGLVSLFGFTTPIPAHFGTERNGYLVTDMKTAIAQARAAGADVLVEPFPDPIGIDAIVQWPGGVNFQLYWHTRPPSYAPLKHVPENRVYLSRDRADAFVRAFLKFSQGSVVSDVADAPGKEIGKPEAAIRRIRIESTFGRMVVYVSDGHLPWPYGAENTGYEVDDLDATLAKAKSLGATVLTDPADFGNRRSAMVQFPGGYVAEIHSAAAKQSR